MLADFETESRHEDILRKQRNKWRAESLKYKERVHNMKEKKEEMYSTKMDKLQKDINKKEKEIKKRLDQNKKAKEEEKKRNIELILKKEKNAKDAYNRKLLREEQEREENEKKILEKCKLNKFLIYKYILFFYLVETFKERNEINQKKRHETELNKLIKSEIRHNKNVLNEKEKFEQKANDNQEKLMKKYISFYWNRRNREDKKKEKFLHFNEKYEEKCGRLEEIEKKTEN